MPVPCRKLVRDRIPEIIQSEGRRPVTRVLDEAGYREALLAKLIEEAQEASHATADDIPGELADLLWRAVEHRDTCCCRSVRESRAKAGAG